MKYLSIMLFFLSCSTPNKGVKREIISIADKTKNITTLLDTTKSVKNIDTIQQFGTGLNKIKEINGINDKGKFLMNFFAKSNSNKSIKNYKLTNVLNGGIHIKGDYSGKTTKYYKRINIENIEITGYKNNAVKISSTNTRTYLNNIKLIQNDSVAAVEGGSKGISLVTDHRYPEIGMTHNIHNIQIKYARASFLYMQNPYSYYVKSIKSDSAFYNSDGSSAMIHASGVAFMKWRHYGRTKGRMFKIDTIQFTHTNPSEKLKTIDGKIAGRYRDLVRWENIPFLEANYLEFDNVFHINGDGIIKKLVVRGKFTNIAAIDGIDIDELVLINARFILKNSTIGKLIEIGKNDFTKKNVIIKRRR